MSYFIYVQTYLRVINIGNNNNKMQLTDILYVLGSRFFLLENNNFLCYKSLKLGNISRTN